MSIPETPSCPPWCVTRHDPARGEDDWVHQSEPLMLEGATAHVCLSVDPVTGERDGPYVLMGDTQLDLPEARRAGEGLIALVRLALAQPGHTV